VEELLAARGIVVSYESLLANPAISGTWMKFLSIFAASDTTYGGSWTRMAMNSISWFSADATNKQCSVSSASDFGK
jgi:hypothetical protein